MASHGPVVLGRPSHHFLLRLRLALCVAGLSVVAGCARHDAVEISAWTLDAAGSASRVTLPARLHVAHDVPTYVLRADVTVPQLWRGAETSLSIPHFLGLVALTIDGVAVPPALGDSVSVYRAVGPHVWSLPPSAAPVRRLELHVRHTFTQSAWWGTLPRLSAGRAGDAATARARDLNTWLGAASLATLLIISFTYLVIIASDRGRREYALRAVETLGAATYSAFVLGVGRAWPGVAEIPLLGFGLSTAAFAALHTLSLKFDVPRPGRAWTIAWAVYAGMCLVFSGPFRATPFLGPPCVALLALMIGWNWVRLVRLARRRPRPAGVWPALLSWMGLVFGTPPDFTPWIGLPDVLVGVRIATLGLAQYALFQFVAISVALVGSLRRADGLNVELRTNLALAQRQKDEIEQLAVELRRQVADRSQKLAEALSKLANDERAPLAPGEVVDGRYAIVRGIGEGAMGTVYEVVRTSDGRRFALKVLSRVFNTAQLARFAREAQIASTFHHPNVVGIVDVSFSSSGFMYLVMELVDGRSLRDHAAQFGPSSWAVAVLREVATGLAAIHERGVIHRDLKPANVIVATPADLDAPVIVKIADFGIAGLSEREPREVAVAATNAAESDDARPATLMTQAEPMAPLRTGTRPRPEVDHDEDDDSDAPPRSRSTSTPSLTRTGALLGTPDYMAPELAGSARNASTASDVFSMGVLAYELLSSARPFAVPPCFSRSRRMPIVAPLPLAARGAVSAEMAALVDRALSFVPEERPTASQIAAALGEPAERACAVGAP